MSVHANSLDAYHAEEPKLTRRAEAIYAWITEHGPHTDREVMQGMGFSEPNAVRPRITELIEAGKLMEVGDVRCPVTGKRVRRIDIRRPRQGLLFSSAGLEVESSAPSTIASPARPVGRTAPIPPSAESCTGRTTP